MKQAILSILVGIMIGLMAFCAFQGSSDPKPQTEIASGTSDNEAADDSQVTAAKATDAPHVIAAPADSSSDHYDGLVLLDNDVCAVVLTGLETNEYFGYTWNLTLKNKTDQNLVFTMDNVVVNGFQWDPYWMETVSAGSGTEAKVCWYHDPTEIGIDKVTLVEFELSVYDDDHWEQEDLVSEQLTVYPLGEDAHTQMYQRESLESDLVLVDDENITVTLISAQTEEDWGYTWDLYLENKTEHDLMFNADNVCINGMVCDPFWSALVSAGAKTVSSVHWYEEDLDTCGITDITMVELNLWVYDEEDWDADYIYDDTLTVCPMGQEAAAVQKRQSLPTDNLLVDNDLFSITVMGFDSEELWGYSVELYLENKSPEDLMFTLDGATVNGRSLDPFWMESIPAGRNGYSEILWFESDLEEAHIPEVVELELPFTVTQDDYPYGILWNGTFSVIP